MPQRETSSQQDRPDIGSALTISFTPKFNAVIVAPTKDEEVPIYKFPCGKVEYIDIPGPESSEFEKLTATLYGGNTPDYEEIVKAVASGERLDYRSQRENEDSSEYGVFLSALAKNCAMRELHVEADITEDKFLFVSQLEYVRSFWKRDQSNAHVRKFLRQFHFFGVLEKQDQLSKNCPESAEMGDPEYWDPVLVLKWDTPKETGRQFNPFHQIAFVQSLLKLRTMKVEEEIPEFADLLVRIDQAGFVLDEYEDLLREKMKKREL